MKKDEPVTDEHPGTDELARRLEAYAAARLTPDRFAVARMRGRILDAAERRAALLRTMDEATSRPVPLRTRRMAARRRAAGLLLAATLGLTLATGVTAASMAGGPLYGARLWIESVTLPSDGDARTSARVAQLTDRLAEAQHAAGAGDGSAVAAALEAYREDVAEALEEAGGDDDRLARLQAALGTHIAVLEALLGIVPDQARDAIGDALDSSHRAVDRIEADTPDPKPSKDPGGPDASRHPDRTDHPGRSDTSEAPSSP